MMNWKETPPTDCKVRNVVRFLTKENISKAEMHQRIIIEALTAEK